MKNLIFSLGILLALSSCGQQELQDELKRSTEEMRKTSEKLKEAVESVNTSTNSIDTSEDRISEANDVLDKLNNVLSTLEGYFRVFAVDCTSLVFRYEYLNPSMTDDQLEGFKTERNEYAVMGVPLKDLKVIFSAKNPDKKFYLIPESFQADPEISFYLPTMSEYVLKPGSQCELMLATVEANFARLQETVMAVVEGLIDQVTGGQADKPALNCTNYLADLKEQERLFYERLNSSWFKRFKNLFKSEKNKTFQYDKNHPCLLADFEPYTATQMSELPNTLEKNWENYKNQWDHFYTNFKNGELGIEALKTDFIFPLAVEPKTPEYKAQYFEEYVFNASELLKPIANSSLGFGKSVSDENFRKRLKQHLGDIMKIGPREPYIFQFEVLDLDKEIKICREIFDVLWSANGETEIQIAKEFLISSIFFIYDQQVVRNKIELTEQKGVKKVEDGVVATSALLDISKKKRNQ
jgi:hypothetical protein